MQYYEGLNAELRNGASEKITVKKDGLFALIIFYDLLDDKEKAH